MVALISSSFPHSYDTDFLLKHRQRCYERRKKRRSGWRRREGNEVRVMLPGDSHTVTDGYVRQG